MKFFRDVIRKAESDLKQENTSEFLQRPFEDTLSTKIKKHAKCRHLRLEFNFARLTELFYGDLIWGYLKINHQKNLNSLKEIFTTSLLCLNI